MTKIITYVLKGFLFIVLMGGCSTTYEPRLVLPTSAFNRSIDANVEVHPFIL